MALALALACSSLYALPFPSLLALTDHLDGRWSIAYQPYYYCGYSKTRTLWNRDEKEQWTKGQYQGPILAWSPTLPLSLAHPPEAARQLNSFVELSPHLGPLTAIHRDHEGHQEGLEMHWKAIVVTDALFREHGGRPGLGMGGG